MRLSQKPPSKIVGIQFSMLSSGDIAKNSVCEIKNKATYLLNKPILNGLFSPQMGICNDLGSGEIMICPTDGLNANKCPGYFGHLSLAKPVFNYPHLSEIIKVLKCICLKCANLLLDVEANQCILLKPAEERLDECVKLSGNITRCGDCSSTGCGTKKPTKIRQSPDNIASLTATWAFTPNNIQAKISPEIVYKMMKRITDENVIFLGFHPNFSRPESMIFYDSLPIAPPTTRPSVKPDSQQRCEDELTHLYVHVVKANDDLNKRIAKEKELNILPDSNESKIDQYLILLQYNVALLANNKIKGFAPITQRSGKPLQSIKSRIDGKAGRIRWNLMGKRVNKSARSVITGDPNISAKEVGIPEEIAKRITCPVVVNDRNRDDLNQYIKNGPDIYPGAKFYQEYKDGPLKSLQGGTSEDRENIYLPNGAIIYRHTITGDYSLFNRQPSLHKMSANGHRIVVLKKGSTFRVNLSVTKAYNADFDKQLCRKQAA